MQFEGLQANFLPIFNTNPPPRPYKGLNYDGGVVFKTAPVWVASIYTSNSPQFLGTNALGTIVISATQSSDTFSFKSCEVGLYIATGITELVPPMDGTIVFTGTKPDGSQVVEKVQYTAASIWAIKLLGITLLGRAQTIPKTFTTLSGLTTLRITAENTALFNILRNNATGNPIKDIKTLLGIDVTTALTGIAVDSLNYDVITQTA